MSTRPEMQGKVYLIGGGPGDPSLITLRACECLRRADVVLYDYLVNPQILTHARPEAELVCLGKHGRDRILPQDEINRRLVALARQGRTVVRLKGGDPMIFGHAVEEVEALAAAGIEYELVPGITAAIAAGSYAAIPLTHGQLASAVALVTGQEREGKGSPALDYAALAAFPGTLVFYMGVTTAPRWTSALVAAGKPPDTPAAIVRRCSWPDQETIVCELGDVAREMKARKLRPPVIVLVGDVVAYSGTLDWLIRRPLFGQRVLVTRPLEQAQKPRALLAELGADVLVQPAIKIGPPADWGPVDAALARLDQFDWLVFSSANGVRAVMDRLLASGRDVRAIGALKLAAIGPGTAQELAKYHLRADVVPDEFRAESLAGALAQEAAGRKFLLARASRGREVLAEELTAAGGNIEQIVVYASVDVKRPSAEVAEAMTAGEIDWVTVTSSAIARSLVAMFGESLRRSRLASISPVTSATLGELGYPPAVEASEYTLEGLVAAISRAVAD